MKEDKNHKNFIRSVHICSFSGACFPAVGLNTEIYREILCIHFKCGKVWTRKSPNMNSFHVVKPLSSVLDVGTLSSPAGKY